MLYQSGRSVLVLGILVFNLIGIGCEQCSVAKDGSSRNQTNNMETFSCPRASDPQDMTECCINERNEPYCCGSSSTGFFGTSDQTLMFVSVGVICVCLVSTVVIVLCCFYNKCPLYSACRVRYSNQNDIVAFSTKEEQMKLHDMPADEDSQRKYEPNAVTIRPVCDV